MYTEYSSCRGGEVGLFVRDRRGVSRGSHLGMEMRLSRHVEDSQEILIGLE